MRRDKEMATWMMVGLCVGALLGTGACMAHRIWKLRRARRRIQERIAELTGC